MSSRHRKTTATSTARVAASDLSHGGVTAAELFAKFQSGQHLRDGRSTAEATQSDHRRNRMSPARRHQVDLAHNKSSSRTVRQQDSVSSRLSTPKPSRGTLFQQSQAEQEAAALVRHPSTPLGCQTLSRRCTSTLYIRSHTQAHANMHPHQSAELVFTDHSLHCCTCMVRRKLLHGQWQQQRGRSWISKGVQLRQLSGATILEVSACV